MSATAMPRLARQAHPIAYLLPPMTEGEFAELRESIRVNGLREPIVLHRDGRIIDGRHRALACAELGIDAASRTFDKPDSAILAFVLDLNLKRRHLSESQRAMIAASLANIDGKGRPAVNAPIGAISQTDAATMLNVGRRSVQRAAVVLDSAIPAIIDAVRGGHMPVSQGAKVAVMPEPRQQQVAAEMHNGKSLATTVLAATRAERVATIERASAVVPLSALGRRFPVLYADPPWAFEPWSAGGQLKAAEMQYPTMAISDIAALPVGDIAATDSVLFLWSLPAMFPEALQVVSAWGFTFKTFAVWVKRRIGCGFWFRGQHEPLIVATRGNMPPPAHLHSSVFEGATSGAHSEKPDEVRDWIAEAYPQAGRIELFARSAAPGWTTWGNQAPTA